MRLRRADAAIKKEAYVYGITPERNQMLKRYLFYLIRWQLSTPILTLVLTWLSDMDTLLATIIANLIGGLIFFWVDSFIFKTMARSPLWEIRENVKCADCGKTGRGYRVAEWFGYNRVQDKTLNLDARNAANASWRR